MKIKGDSKMKKYQTIISQKYLSNYFVRNLVKVLLKIIQHSIDFVADHSFLCPKLCMSVFICLRFEREVARKENKNRAKKISK